MLIFYFYLVCFTFSISYSVLPFHLVCFSFSPSLLFFKVFFLKPSSSVVEKLLYTYIYINNMYNIYIRKFMNFCLTKKIYDILIPLV